MHALVDGVAPPAEAALRLAGIAVTQLKSNLSEEETAEATTILERLGAREQATARARAYRDTALVSLRQVPVASGSSILEEFVTTVLPRV